MEFLFKIAVWGFILYFGGMALHFIFMIFVMIFAGISALIEKTKDSIEEKELLEKGEEEDEKE